MHRYISLIPARGGSKGIEKKNIFPIGGKPLISYTIQASLKVSSILNTFVSSEDAEIIKVSSQYGAEIIKRPNILSLDTTPTVDVIEDAIVQLDKKKIDYDSIILLQPTSPLRDCRDIEKAINIFNEIKDSNKILVSVFQPSNSPYKSYKLGVDGKLESLFDAWYPNQRRQDLPRTYSPNGAIYIFLREYFIKNKVLYSPNMYPFIMEGKRSIDIDNLEDLQLAEIILSRLPIHDGT